MKKIFLLVGIAIMLVLSCGNEGKNSSEAGGGKSKDSFKIGITQIVAHPALDSAREGFKDAFKEAGLKVVFDEKNANGEIATANMIANNFVTEKVDMIYAIATSTAQAAAQSTDKIPVVFSAITDPEAAGILKKNVTGISDRVNVKQQLELLLKLDSKIKKVGVIYNSSEQNSKVQVDDLKKAASELGITIVEKSVTQVSEIPQASETLVKESDALYLPTDNLVASVVNLITEKAIKAKKIAFGAESAHVKGGALITQGIDYYEMGKEAGKKLEGHEIDVAYSSTLERAFDTARYMLDNSNSENNKNLSVIKDKRLIEKSYGGYEGVSFAEYGAGLKAGETRGMELDTEAADRVEEFFKEKYNEHPDKTILAVCHGGLIRSFLTQKGIKEVSRGVIINTSVSVLDYDGEKFTLVEFNK